MKILINYFNLVLVLMSLNLIINGCTKENEEDLLGDNYCDTTNVNYSTISVILNNSSCVSCHNTDFTNREGIVLDSYANVVTSFNTDLVWAAINHQDGLTPMPYNLPKLSDCNLNNIGAWINAGMPE